MPVTNLRGAARSLPVSKLHGEPTEVRSGGLPRCCPAGRVVGCAQRAVECWFGSGPVGCSPRGGGLFAVLAWRDGDTGRFGACGLVATAAAATRWASFYVAFAPRWVSIGLASAASIGWLWLCWRHATGRTRM